MTDNTSHRAPRASDLLVFHDHHAPPLHDGLYTLSVTQEVGVELPAWSAAQGRIVTTTNTVKGTQSLRFRISGPQIALDPADIVATYPAHLASGRFDTVLPHVSLSRATLPWERSPQASGPLRPWLVLVIIAEGDTGLVSQTTVRADQAPGSIATDDVAPDATMRLLAVTDTLVGTHFPTVDDLQWLAHVRSVVPQGGTAEAETATILSARLPEPGRMNHAFLLSVENRYPLATSGQQAFPILHQWSFFCMDESAHDFTGYLLEADAPGRFALPTGSADTQARRAAGYVPMAMNTRDGGQAACWYHGPLLPGAPPIAAAEVLAALDGVPGHASVGGADALLLVDDAFAMLDMSYAAAWELGRLVALEDLSIAEEIQDWKHARARAAALSAQAAGAAGLPNAPAVPPAPDLPAEVATWLKRSIIELRAVPRTYLVPDEAMLPPSSLRFFDVDSGWLDALRDGALSVGRTDGAARALDLAMRSALPDPPEMSRMLLRSGVVADFPDLEITAYAAGAASTMPDFSGSALKVLRMDRLSPTVLLVLFEGKVATADVHLHPAATHFGVTHAPNSTPATPVFEKAAAHGPPVPPIPIAAAPPDMTALRRLDMMRLARRLGVTATPGGGHVADFALAMLEGVPLVRFSRP